MWNGGGSPHDLMFLLVASIPSALDYSFQVAKCKSQNLNFPSRPFPQEILDPSPLKSRPFVASFRFFPLGFSGWQKGLVFHGHGCFISRVSTPESGIPPRGFSEARLRLWKLVEKADPGCSTLDAGKIRWFYRRSRGQRTQGSRIYNQDQRSRIQNPVSSISFLSPGSTI